MKVENLLKHSFRPEFLNRLGEIVFYKPLTKENIYSIITLLINDLNKRLKEKQLSCVVTDTAKEFIVEHGYDVIYGARPLKRFIQRYVETLIAKKIIVDDIAPDTVLTVDVKDEQLIVQ